MNTEQKREILAKFVAKSDIRYYLTKPIRQDGYLYATNGHIICRVEDDAEIDASTFGKEGNPAPNCAKLFAAIPEREFAPLVIDLPPATSCLACNGSGKVFACKDCDGDGEFDHGNHTYDCKECGGDGYAANGKGLAGDCGDCDGTGKNMLGSIDYGSTSFAHRYLALLLSLDQPELALNPADPDSSVKFRFVGGEGIVMPMRGKW